MATKSYIRGEGLLMEQGSTVSGKEEYVRDFETGGSVEELGGKGHRLAELYRAGFPVPQGFVLTSQAYEVATTSGDDHPRIPSDVHTALLDQYRNKLNSTRVVVRSSGVSEDAEGSSLAGLFSSILDVEEEGLSSAVSEVYASLRQPQVQEYLRNQNLDSADLRTAVVIQKQIEPWISGVCFTAHPVTGEPQYIVEYVLGRSLNLVSGRESPTRLVFNEDFSPIEDSGSASASNEAISAVRELIETSARIAEFFGQPQDIEWAVTPDQNLHVLQSRPITTIHNGGSYQQIQDGNLIYQGVGISPGIARGPARRVSSDLDAVEVDRLLQSGDIAIGHALLLENLVGLAKCSGVISVESSMLSHVAIRARELGIPSVGGVSDALKLVDDGQLLTIDGTQGSVYLGSVEESAATTEKTSIGYDPVDMEVIKTASGHIIYQRLDNKVRVYTKNPEDPNLSAEVVTVVTETLNVTPQNVEIDHHLAWEGSRAPSMVYMQHETFESISEDSHFADGLSQAREFSRRLDASALRAIVDFADSRAKECFTKAVQKLESFKETTSREEAVQAAQFFDEAKKTAVDFVGNSIIDVLGESAVRHYAEDLKSRYDISMIDIFTAGDSGAAPQKLDPTDDELFRRLARYTCALGELKNRRLDVLTVNGFTGMDFIRSLMELDLVDLVEQYGW